MLLTTNELRKEQDLVIFWKDYDRQAPGRRGGVRDPLEGGGRARGGAKATVLETSGAKQGVGGEVA